MNFFLESYTIFSGSDKDKLRWKLIRRYFRGMDDAGEDGRGWYVQNTLRTGAQSKDRKECYGKTGKQHIHIAATAGQKNKIIRLIFCIICTHNKWNPTKILRYPTISPILVSASMNALNVLHHIVRRDRHFLFISVPELCCQPLCHNCFHFAVIFEFLAVKVSFQR